MLGILSYTAGGNVNWTVFLEGNLAIRKCIHHLTGIPVLGIDLFKNQKNVQTYVHFFTIIKKQQKRGRII